MKALQNGKYISINGESEEREAMSLECVCGHSLGQHGYVHALGSTRMLETDGCNRCDCAQFKMRGKIERRSVQYAQY